VETRWLDRTLGLRVRVFVRAIWVTLPTMTIASRVGVILWWTVEAVECIEVFNARGAIVTVN